MIHTINQIIFYYMMAGLILRFSIEPWAIWMDAIYYLITFTFINLCFSKLMCPEEIQGNFYKGGL